jgi:two-component system phosphate regulon sensor histidine kinase PhoR
MTKNRFRVILLLMAIALVGIVSLQFVMIKDSYVQKELLFDQNVHASLVDVVKKVEKMEAIDFIEMKSNKLNKIYVSTESKVSKEEVSENPRLHTNNELENRKAQLAEARRRSIKDHRNFELDRAKLQISADSLSKLAAEMEIDFRNSDFNINIPDVVVWDDSNSFPKYKRPLNDHVKIYKDSITSYYSYTISDEPSKFSTTKPQRARIVVRNDFPKAPPAPPIPPTYLQGPLIIFDNEPTPKRVALKTILDREKKNKEQVIKDLAAELDALTIPLENRIKPQVIDSLLKIELKKRGILLDFDLVIKNNKEHKVFFTTVNEGIDSRDDYYSAVLFENVGNEEAPYINIAFPEKKQMISDAMVPVLGSSLFLLLMLLTAFAYTIQAILKQKKLSDLKNDFINNMTHEFKTPVSTILLASEALKDPSVVKDEPRVHRLASIIYDENLRLGEHVERVLNMARMDKGEIKLAMNAVSLHDVINDVLKHMELSLANKNQQIVLNFNASKDSVYADAFHLKNIVQNLIDNASKYSSADSRIFIETEMQQDFVKLKVKDQGIGMKKDQVKKIFEPFYRVPTGNLHDVKGFGIGLHYVYSILKAMGGKISVKSEMGLGSEFSVLLPKEL